MSANFTPNQNEYKNLTPFKTWLMLQINTWGMTNFPFVESDFDELTNYGMMQKLMNAVNDVIANENEVEQDITNLFGAFTELQNYVNEYFDNLDVQDEINAKLDEMAQDGSLTNLISAYLQPRIDAQNQVISEIDAKVDAVANGSPLVATSTAGMTDTTKTYVNTTDGNWYYYDGDSWEIGGVYQSTGIADGSITILKLDNALQSNFNIELGDNLCPETGLTTYYTENSSHDVVTHDLTGYASFTYNLELGKTYFFTGFNRYSAQALLIVKNNKVIYNSITSDTSGVIGASYIITPNENGLTAYINRIKQDPTNNNAFNNYYLTFLQTIKNVYNNLKVKGTISKLVSVPNTYVHQNTQVGAMCNFAVLQNYGFDVYQMNKGLKYHVQSVNRYNISGLVLTDSKYYMTYTSWESYASTDESVDMTFVAENDGFIIVPNIATASPYVGQVSIEYDTIEVRTSMDNITGKKVLWNGDSICAGYGNPVVNYSTQLSAKYDLQSTNYAVSGRCIAKEDGETSILETIETMDSTADFVIFEGGWNDMWRVPLGEISDGFDAELDEYTWSGALESMIKKLLIKYPTAKKGFILAHGKANNESEITRQNNYWNRAIEVFNKWHFPYIDLRHNGLCAFNETLLDMFFKTSPQTGHGDGTHPNPLGYETFYDTPIAMWMNRL